MIRATFVLLFLMVLGVPAPGEARDDAETASETEPVESTDPSENGVYGEDLFVESTLEFIPSSNTIAAKLPLPLRLTPASVGVVGAPVIEEQGAQVLGDALRNISGLNVQTGNGVFDFFVVRGFDSVSSSLILTDGAPEPESSFYQLYNIERVEVLKGPSAFLYGGSPLAGTANLVRKQPLPGGFSRIGIGFGSFGTAEATFDGNIASDDGRWSFRLNGYGRTADGYREDKESETLAFNPAFTWRPDEGTRLSVTVEHLDVEYSSDAGLPLVFGAEVAAVPRQRSYQSPFDLSVQKIDRVQVDYERRIGDRLILRDKAYYRSFAWESGGTIFNGVFPSATGSLEVSRSLLQLDDDQRFLGNQLEALITAGRGRVTHNLLAGVEIARFADEFTFDVGVLPNVDLFNPVETAAGPIFNLPGQSLGADARSLVTAPYLVDQISLGDEVQVLIGARFDAVDFKDDAAGFSRDDDELSPMLGIVWAPTPELSLYANTGEAFAPPSTFANAEDRIPEESRQLEVGLKRSFLSGKVASSLALYDLERENIAIPDDNGITRQTGDQRSRGLELEITAQPRPRLRLLFAYAYTDGELTEFAESAFVFFPVPGFVTLDRSGNTPAFTPEHIARLWVSKGLGRGVIVSGGARFVSDQFIAEDNLFEIGGYVTFDASVSYRNGPWRLQLNLENLADEDYLTRGFGATSVIPAPGFAASTRFQYAF